MREPAELLRPFIDAIKYSRENQKATRVQFLKVGHNPTNGSWWMVQVQPSFAGSARQFSARACLP
jgi:hypothetical protein